jgi:hypothetical protein
MNSFWAMLASECHFAEFRKFSALLTRLLSAAADTAAQILWRGRLINLWKEKFRAGNPGKQHVFKETAGAPLPTSPCAPARRIRPISVGGVETPPGPSAPGSANICIGHSFRLPDWQSPRTAAWSRVAAVHIAMDHPRV